MTSETVEIQICGRYLALSPVSQNGVIRNDYYSGAGRSTTELTNYSLFQLDESENILTDGCYYPSGQI